MPTAEAIGVCVVLGVATILAMKYVFEPLDNYFFDLRQKEQLKAKKAKLQAQGLIPTEDDWEYDPAHHLFFHRGRKELWEPCLKEGVPIHPELALKFGVISSEDIESEMAEFEIRKDKYFNSVAQEKE